MNRKGLIIIRTFYIFVMLAPIVLNDLTWHYLILLAFAVFLFVCDYMANGRGRG